MSASLEFFAGVVTLVMLVGCLLERKKSVKKSRLFAWCLFCHASMLLIDAPIWLILAKPSPEKVATVKILSFFSDAFFCAIISLYAYCLTEYVSETKKISYRFAHVLTVLCGVSALLYFVNIFSGTYIYYDETGLDRTGPLYLLSQIINIALPASTMIFAIFDLKLYAKKKSAAK